jgi:uncharacterized membrane protein YkvA (DUF1232 family)
MFARFLAAQLVGRLGSRLTGGKVSKPGKMQAVLRLPTLLRLGYALIRDERIPIWQRGTVLGLLVLIFSPLDVVGDIPVIGQFWDFTLSVVVLDAFVSLAPAPVVNEHILALGIEKKIPLRDV